MDRSLLMRGARLVTPVAAALCLMLAVASDASAQGGFGSHLGLGIAVNGSCMVGLCPPAATPANTNNTQPFSFNITLPNGDKYRVTGNISIQSDGFNCPGGEIFMVTYTGNGAGTTPSQADTLTFDNLRACASTATNTNVGHAFAVTFSSGIAASSSVTSSGIANGVQLPAIGPVSPPGPFQHTDVVSVGGNGIEFSGETKYVITFGAGSPVGSTIWTGFTPVNPNGLVSSVLPTARTSSAQSSSFGTVTAFATVINTNSTTATACSISAPSGLPVTMLFQTTNPATNVPTGTQNTPVSIAPGQSQSFYFAMTPTAEFSEDVPLAFTCTNTAPAAIVPGLNTFLLTASNAPLPDMVSIAATATGDGILHAPSRTATVAFAQAAINIAATGSVTFTPTTTAFGQPQRNLPLTMTICPSDPATGACLQPPAPSATVQIANNQVVTLSIFVQGQGQAIPFDPANNRVYIIATQGGTAVGASSVALDVP